MEYVDYKEFLASIVKFNKSKTIVEIGVQFGYTTQHLCLASAPNGFVYGYDVFDVHGLKKQFPMFESIESVKTRLNTICKNFKLTKINTFSEEFREILGYDTSGAIDFAFIDGCHSYKGIKNDFDAVYPLLTKAGIIAFHDTANIDGCREFMVDLRTKYYDGTFDLVDFPWGIDQRRCGVSLLVKRSYPTLQLPIIEVCNLENTNDSILKKEKDWYESEVSKQTKK